MTSITDPLGKVTTAAYTFAPGTCRPTRVELRNPLQQLTVVTFNGNGLPATVTDPNNNTITLNYDPLHPSRVAPRPQQRSLGREELYSYYRAAEITAPTSRASPTARGKSPPSTSTMPRTTQKAP